VKVEFDEDGDLQEEKCLVGVSRFETDSKLRNRLCMEGINYVLMKSIMKSKEPILNALESIMDFINFKLILTKYVLFFY